MHKNYLDGWLMLVCNPISGTGHGVQRLAQVCRSLAQAGVRYASATTQGPGDAARLARSAIAAGCSAVIAIGGDGTFFEVLNGAMPPELSPEVEAPVPLGLIQAGRGSDFGRSAGVPSDPNSAIQRLLQGRTEQIDIGHVTYLAMNGRLRARYFANAAGLGFDAEVALRANSGPRVMGGTVTYLSSLLSTLVDYRNKRMVAWIDGGPGWEGRANSFVVANGQYFGGGMKIAPEAKLSDNLFSIVVLGDLGKLDLIRNVPTVYDGSHAAHPKVRMLTGSRVEVRSPDRLLLQADGEVLGMAPALFRVVPRALRLVI
ncbi:MAG TPA: diacylglycerol kinase family protein [Chloroflexia bacterium]|nr:diacylglycerol kinase family protein [Chloroflexia bacterium]